MQTTLLCPRLRQRRPRTYGAGAGLFPFFTYFPPRMARQGAQLPRVSPALPRARLRALSAACQKDHLVHFCSATGCRRARKTPTRYRDYVKEGATACCCLLEHGILHPTQPRMSPKACLESSMKPCFCFKQVLVDAGVAAAAASKKSEFRPAGSHSPLLRACKWLWAATMTQHGASQLALRPAWCLNLVTPAALPLYLRFSPFGATFGAQAA